MNSGGTITAACLFNRRIEFSKRLVFAYTCIVIIPLVVLFIFIVAITDRVQYKELRIQCEKETRDNAARIAGNIDTFNLLDTMIQTNNDLMMFYSNPENCDESDIIETTTREVTTIERLMSVMPSIYSVRIFADSPVIPERWPVIMHSTRSDFSKLKPWEINYVAEYMGTQDGLKSLSVCATRRLIKSRREIGWLQVSMRMNDFFPFLYHVPEPYQNDYVYEVQRNGLTVNLLPVTNRRIKLMNTPLSDKETARLAYAFSRSKGMGTVRIPGKNGAHIMSWRFVPELNVVLVHTCAVSMAYGQLFLISVLAILGLFASGMVLFLLIRTTTSRLMSGVYSIMDGMKQVRAGNLDVNVKVSSRDEVGETQRTFNSMTEQLRTQIEQIKSEQQLIADTEMKAMQNQINAHFLYNVLETIRMQAVIADQDDIAESVMVLGKMMRYCLRWRVHTVTLAQEIEYISSYIYILNIRNDYVITLEADIPDEYETLMIPKMLIQPFVENAFNYAIEPFAKDAVIRIYTDPDSDGRRLWLCVQDYGCGMSREKLAEIQKYLADEKYERDTKGSIGIKNIQQRLTMFFGKDFHLVIQSEEGKGTLIRIPVPLAFYADLPDPGTGGGASR